MMRIEDTGVQKLDGEMIKWRWRCFANMRAKVEISEDFYLCSYLDSMAHCLLASLAIRVF